MGDDSEAIKEMIKSEKVSKPFVLLSAAAFNAGNTAKLMLANETDINAADPDGWTPLLVACTHNMADMAWYLVNNGADINKKSQYGTTALMLAVANSNFQVAQLLIQKGALVNERMFDYTALRFARDIDRQDIVELLLTSGATE